MRAATPALPRAFQMCCTKAVSFEGKCHKPLQSTVYLVGSFGYKLLAPVAELDGQRRKSQVGGKKKSGSGGKKHGKK